MKVNKMKLGLGVLTVLATPIAVNTVASSDALAAQGWVKTGNAWYFYNQNGTLARNAWAGNYWLGADGKMVTNAWVDNGRYYVDANGAWVKGAQKPATPKPVVAQKQGWVQSGGAWYFYHQGQIVRNAWVGSYWLGADGKMATSSWVDNGRYYVGANGAWVKDAKKPEAPKPVEKKQGWVKEGNTWYYFENGVLARNKWISSTYWVGADGKMATNQWVDNYRYYVGADGAWLPNPSSKGNQKEILLNLARGYIGVEQFDSRHNTMVSIYNSGKSSYSGYRVSTYDDWCDIFVSSMYQHSGLIDLIDKEAYVPQHIRLMKNKGIWIGKTTPQPGDVITFDWNIDGVADHIAIVEKVEGDKVITIEGNTSDRNYDESKVVRKSHRLNARYIIGYSRPQYK